MFMFLKKNLQVKLSSNTKEILMRFNKEKFNKCDRKICSQQINTEAGRDGIVTSKAKIKGEFRLNGVRNCKVWKKRHISWHLIYFLESRTLTNIKSTINPSGLVMRLSTSFCHHVSFSQIFVGLHENQHTAINRLTYKFAL